MSGVDPELLRYVHDRLPAAPARVLEIGAGDGELARTLATDGWDVVAIDPDPRAPGVVRAGLLELDEPAGAFDAAVAVTSLHHVEPLEESVAHLAGLLDPGSVLVVDEFDVGAFDERAAAWWLDQRRARGGAPEKTADQLVHEHRDHLHALPAIVAALEPHFDVEPPAYRSYLYRWKLDESVRPAEEEAIARGEIPAVGARFVARRRS